MSFSNQQRPLLTLHVGQAGIQIGHAAWELLCLEHNIEPDGAPKRECQEHGYVDTVFVATSQGNYYPRSLFVDTDPFCVDEVRSGPYRRLFNSRQLISENLDSGANYATGRYGYVKTLLPETLERLRWLTEKSDVKPTVCLFHSSSGGTGSGFAVASLTNSLDELGFSGRSTIDFCVVPGLGAIQSSCELLNTALYLDESQKLVGQTICVSNSALFRVCSSQLQSNGRATYAHVNRILAAAFSNLTATERLPGSSVSFHSILDSLLPYEHLKYTLLACAPYLTKELSRSEKFTAKSVAAAVLEPGSQFLDVDLRQGRHAAGFLLFRGATNLGEVQNVASDLNAKNRVQFYDWVPSGFRTGLTLMPPLAAPNSGFASPSLSVTLLASHSGVSGVFSRLAAAGRQLQDLDLFVHRYEGAIVALLSRDGVSGALEMFPASAGNTAAAAAPAAESSTAKALSNWMAAGGYKHYQDQHRHHQHKKRQPQDQEEEPVAAGRASKQRTCGMSDVFGVRQRLASAIHFLQRVAAVYREDNAGIDTGGSVEPAIRLEENDSDGDSKIAVPSLDGDEKPTAREPPSQQDQAGEKQLRQVEVKHPMIGSPETDGEAMRWYEPTEKSSTGEEDSSDDITRKHRRKNPQLSAQQQMMQLKLQDELPDQVQQSQNQASMYSDDSDLLITSVSSNSNSNSSLSVSSTTLRGHLGNAMRRAAAQLSCIRRRSSRSNGCSNWAKKSRAAAVHVDAKDRRLPNQQFSWSPRPRAAAATDSTIDSQLAIARALRILEKYGPLQQQQQQQTMDSDN